MPWISLGAVEINARLFKAGCPGLAYSQFVLGEYLSWARYSF